MRGRATIKGTLLGSEFFFKFSIPHHLIEWGFLKSNIPPPTLLTTMMESEEEDVWPSGRFRLKDSEPFMLDFQERNCYKDCDCELQLSNQPLCSQLKLPRIWIWAGFQQWRPRSTNEDDCEKGCCLVSANPQGGDKSTAHKAIVSLGCLNWEQYWWWWWWWWWWWSTWLWWLCWRWSQCLCPDAFFVC